MGEVASVVTAVSSVQSYLVQYPHEDVLSINISVDQNGRNAAALNDRWKELVQLKGQIDYDQYVNLIVISLKW